MTPRTHDGETVSSHVDVDGRFVKGMCCERLHESDCSFFSLCRKHSVLLSANQSSPVNVVRCRTGFRCCGTVFNVVHTIRLVSQVCLLTAGSRYGTVHATPTSGKGWGLFRVEGNRNGGGGRIVGENTWQIQAHRCWLLFLGPKGYKCSLLSELSEPWLIFQSTAPTALSAQLSPAPIPFQFPWPSVPIFGMEKVNAWDPKARLPG